MVAESTEVARRVAGKPTRNGRRARVLIDKRFALGRRVKELTLTFRARLALAAEPDPLLLAAVERAAQLQTLAEEARARALRGDLKVTLDDVVRLNRLAEHAVRALRLDRHKVKKQTLPEYLAARGGSTP